MFDSDNVERRENYDRAKLPPGRYLVKWVDGAEILGGYNGNRTQIDFAVEAGPGVPKGTVKVLQSMQQVEPKKQKLENGKMQGWLAAFASKPGKKFQPAGVTNEFFHSVVRTVKGKSVPNEGFQRLSETFPAEKSPLYGARAVIVSVPHTNKKGQKTVYYNVEAYDGVEEFEAYDPSKFVDEESLAKDDDAGLGEAASAAKAAEELPPPPEEDEPLTKAAKAGWKPRQGYPGWYYNSTTKEQLKEAALIAKFAA